MKSNNLQNNLKKLTSWTVTDSKVVLQDRWIKVKADDCLTDEGVNISPFYVLEYPDWVHMVVINDQNQVLVTQQYRHAGKVISTELPCGTMEQKDTDPVEAAKRELLEETGYTGDFTLAGKVSPNPATHSNHIFVYLVQNPKQVAKPDYDPTEVINYQFIDLQKIYKLIDEGQFPQALHIASLFLGVRKNDQFR
jgi:8-oxo-dGTP pyrophosphatase MutT (NUDIX family)